MKHLKHSGSRWWAEEILFALAFVAAIAVVAQAHLSTMQSSDLPREEVLHRMHTEDRINDAIRGYPAEAVLIDHDKKTIQLDIDDWMTSGTDAACEQSARLFLALTELGFTIHVEGSFVPSNYNPIDLVWARHLNEGSAETPGSD